MRRLWSVLLVVLFLTQGASVAFAAKRGTPEYEKLKEYKKTQKERKANPSPNAKGFWQREAERSGFAGTAAMVSNAIGDAIPLDKPNSRKSE